MTLWKTFCGDPLNPFWKSPSLIHEAFQCMNQANIYLFKVINRYTKKRCEICSKLTTKTPEQHQWHRSGVFTNNFEHISHFYLVLLLLTLNKEKLAGKNTCKLPADIYLLKVKNRNSGTRGEKCSKLSIKTPERRH